MSLPGVPSRLSEYDLFAFASWLLHTAEHPFDEPPACCRHLSLVIHMLQSSLDGPCDALPVPVFVLLRMEGVPPRVVHRFGPDRTYSWGPRFAAASVADHDLHPRVWLGGPPSPTQHANKRSHDGSARLSPPAPVPPPAPASVPPPAPASVPQPAPASVPRIPPPRLSTPPEEFKRPGEPWREASPRRGARQIRYNSPRIPGTASDVPIIHPDCLLPEHVLNGSTPVHYVQGWNWDAPYAPTWFQANALPDNIIVQAWFERGHLCHSYFLDTRPAALVAGFANFARRAASRGGHQGAGTARGRGSARRADGPSRGDPPHRRVDAHPDALGRGAAYPDARGGGWRLGEGGPPKAGRK